MPLLRLTQTALADASWRVELALERERAPRQTATATFPFELAALDEADLRWYFEDFLQWPHDPADWDDRRAASLHLGTAACAPLTSPQPAARRPPSVRQAAERREYAGNGG